jgi:hypothetical protein
MRAALFISVLVACFVKASVEASTNVNFIEFRLFYPVPTLKDGLYRNRIKSSLGLDLQYEFFPFNPRTGFILSPGGWILPLNNYTGGRRQFGESHLLGGFVFRALPATFIDPRLQTSFGPAFAYYSGKKSYPLRVDMRASFNIYAACERYGDPRLALSLTGAYAKYWNSIEILNESYYDVGLALRGSF